MKGGCISNGDHVAMILKKKEEKKKLAELNHLMYFQG